MSSEQARLVREISERLRSTTQRAMRMNATAAGVIGVNPTDLQCIQLLQHGPLTAGELARRTGLTTASMTTVIDRLERAGFVARTRDAADRRRVLVELDAERAGSDVAPVFLPVVQAWRELMADYDARDLQLIATFLGRVEQAIEDAIESYREDRE
ncbi:MarR family winged helix-turn-helix transcriptional regulator [Allostreptomyces psammosilenae]|uniref:DNA-binding MarR family transcriptional regulator n=1 Tax=Allostreptomyces psammosilenae TaxID=1892865 RepID=A0A852ZZZ1_9ACTN|nr:MarR family transcriptional regulator [Allostreptomyces psammosilenae]NYI07943.1 DNA-binding MarR family transcriptional regulator [Allostreptomyces psammosilenae]